MLDIKLIREEPDFVKKKILSKGGDPEVVDYISALDAKRRDMISLRDEMKAYRKVLSEYIYLIKQMPTREETKWEKIVRIVKKLVKKNTGKEI